MNKEFEEMSPAVGSRVTTWPFTLLVSFRFAFSYFTLYMVTFAPRIFRRPIARTYIELWTPIADWVAKHLLGISQPLGTVVGDTSLEYVVILCIALSAVIVTVVWSFLDRKRPNHAVLHEWLRLAVRMWLATYLISYGAGKVFPGQFLLPSPARYLSTYGDSNAMGLLWTLMGVSPGYQSFAGAVELAAGLLLIAPRLNTLGALLASAATMNVLVMNAAYDVQVKIFSAHLLLAAVFILAPDLRKLWEFFILHHSTATRTPLPLFQRNGLNRLMIALQLVFGVYAAAVMLAYGHRRVRDRDELAQKTPFYGIWAVDDFSFDNVVHPPLTTDEVRWQRLVIESPVSVALQMMDGSVQRCSLDLKPTNHKMEIACLNPAHAATFAYHQDAGDTLSLDGIADNHTAQLRLHHVEPKFHLDSRGVRWVHKFPPDFR